MRRLILFILVAALTLAAVLWISDRNDAVSATDQETLHVANQLYSSGSYAEAAQLYQQLLDAGIHNPDLYYNLGNAYFQLEDMGRAILNYTRAQRLAPRDEDIKTNLELALNHAAVTETAGSPLARLVDFGQDYFTLNELALLALLLCFVLLCFWQVSRLIKAQTLKRVTSLALLISVLAFGASSITLAATVYNQQSQPTGIMLAETPINGVKLTLGTEVHILEDKGETLRVSLPGRNLEGWVSADSIEGI